MYIYFFEKRLKIVFSHKNYDFCLKCERALIWKLKEANVNMMNMALARLDTKVFWLFSLFT